ncbi:MAG: SCO family protein [Anaerolineales bacterium]|jgi:protein SCO1/2
MKKLRFAQFLMLTISLIVFLSGCSRANRSLNGSPYDPPRPAPDLELLTMTGEPFSLSDDRGKIVLVYFGYTYCPDICPTTLAEVKLVFEELGDRAEDINLIMVTVDPERDTPGVLQTYLNRFHPRFLGLWGEGRQLEDVMAAYGVFAQKEPSDDPDQYLVSHTARLFLIDQQGYLRTNYSFGTPREEILSDLTLLLDEENQQ